MKKIIGLTSVFMLLFTSVVMAGSYPQLVGVWEGKTTGYNPDKGFVENTLTMEVQKQKDGAFYGVKSLKLLVNGKEVEEQICGTVTREGKVLITEFGDGYMSGILDGDTMVLQYVEDGPKAKAFIHEFKRRK